MYLLFLFIFALSLVHSQRRALFRDVPLIYFFIPLCLVWLNRDFYYQNPEVILANNCRCAFSLSIIQNSSSQYTHRYLFFITGNCLPVNYRGNLEFYFFSAILIDQSTRLC